ncbi:MAG: alpha/beta fold hydrolase [Gemmataceae bacterium]
MPRVSVDGMKFYYQQAGQGPDVVLIHGVTGNMAIWPLINLIDVLATEFRVTAYDMRGHGYSDTPLTDYTSADMAHDLKKLQDALGLGPMYLLGHSFGGVVATHMAVLYPDAVAGMILSDPSFPALRHLEEKVTEWHGWVDYVQQSRRAGLTVSAEAWYDVDDLLKQCANLPAEFEQTFDAEVGPGALRRLKRLAVTTCGRDASEVAGLTAAAIASIRHPVIALYGERSPFLNTCRYLEDNLVNCKVVLVPGGEHRAHEESPAAYVELVQRSFRDLVHFSGSWEFAAEAATR